MAIGRTNAGAGGSGGVNFRVVGGLTQPTSPKENTIWVKTDIEIPYWTTASSNKAPAYVAPKGTVTFWWESATSNEVEGTTAAGFMPIKYKATNPPGNMRLKPINCYQNQDGTASGWKPMEAWLYKGGSGVQFSSEITYYRLPGDECSAITGGWEAKGASTLESWDSGFTAPTVTDLEGAVKVWLDGQFWSGSSNHTRSGGYFTKNKIDFSGISAIKINVMKDYRGSSEYPGTVVFGIASSTSSPLPSLASCTISGAKEYTIDTENVDQECYIYLVEQDSSSEIYIKFSEIFS